MKLIKTRSAWGAVAVGSASALLILASALPASAGTYTSTEGSGPTYTPDTSRVSAAKQANAENVVANFLAENPVPTNEPGSSESEFSAYNAEMQAYWEAVPWDAVVEQWGCTVTLPASVSVQTTGSGAETVVVEEGHACADDAIAAGAAGVVESRSAYLADKGVAFADSTDPADNEVARGSGTGTNVTLSLSRPAVGQIRAGATFTGSGNASAFIRLGQVGSLNGCSAGTVVANGSAGVWASGESRSVTGTVNQNANWSNGWQRDRGSGFTNEGRYCELI